MRRTIALLALAGGMLLLAPVAEAGPVADLLALLGLAPTAPSSPTSPVTDAQNCDTGECE